MSHIIATYLISIGLVLDIFGVVLLFLYGLPPQISRTGTTYVTTEEIDEEEKKQAKKYVFRSWVALGLLVTGFLLQLIGNIFPIQY
jgi:hypothetical protein